MGTADDSHNAGVKRFAHLQHFDGEMIVQRYAGNADKLGTVLLQLLPDPLRPVTSYQEIEDLDLAPVTLEGSSEIGK